MKKSLGLLLLAGAFVVVTTGASGCFGGSTTDTNTTANKNTAVVNKNTNKATTNANVNSANTNAATINSNVDTEEETTITTDETSYKSGDEISVTYDIVGELKDGAWIGIIPASTAHGTEEDGDAADVDWQYLEGSTSGTMTFTAPDEAGDFDIRIYDTEYEGGIELGTSESITISK